MAIQQRKIPLLYKYTNKCSLENETIVAEISRKLIFIPLDLFHLVMQCHS